MTLYDYLAVAALILAIGVNSLSVYLQKTKGIYDRFGRKALLVHGSIVTVAWGIFIITEFTLVNSSWKLVRVYPLLGLLTMGTALCLFILAVRQIGRRALVNGNFFGQPVRRLNGIYRFIRNPIYWSYVLWFIGLGLLTGLKGFFLIAVIAVIGLIGIESRIERV